jgi:hypothetical protein
MNLVQPIKEMLALGQKPHLQIFKTKMQEYRALFDNYSRLELERERNNPFFIDDYLQIQDHLETIQKKLALIKEDTDFESTMKKIREFLAETMRIIQKYPQLKNPRL